MKRLFQIVCVSVMIVSLDASVMAQNQGAPPSGNDFYSTYIVNKLEIGTRITYFMLLDDKKGQPFDGSFFGSVTQLREDQNYLPVKLFVQYRITPQFGVGLAYDQLGFEAGDWGIGGAGTGGADGKAILSGPLFYLLGRYPNETKFTPFCELGFAIYSASFDEEANWGASGRRSVELDSTTGYYLGVGCDMKINDHFLLDLYGRYMNVSDVNGSWFLLGNKNGDVVLTPSYLAIGVGAKYLF